MGLIIEKEAFGEYYVEVQRESFYLGTQDKGRMLFYPTGEENDYGCVEFDIADIPQLRECLNEVEQAHLRRSNQGKQR